MKIFLAAITRLECDLRFRASTLGSGQRRQKRKPGKSLALAFVCLILLKFLPSSSSLRLLPGPSRWPILDNILDMPKISESTQISAMASKYGPIFTLPMGSVPMIVDLNSPKPHHSTTIRNASPYGPRWRVLRRNLVSGVRSSSSMSSYASVREPVIQGLLNQCREESANKGVCFCVEELQVGHLLSYVCFGRQLEEANIKYMDELLREIITSPRFLIGDFVPFLRFLSNKKAKILSHLADKENEFFTSLTKETKKLKEEGRVDPNCYLNSLLAMKSEWKEEELSDKDLVVLCSELINAGVEPINAGVDTTANCLEWCMANVVKYLDIQTKLIGEIEKNVGQRAVQEEEIYKLPYLQALVKETLRKHPPGEGTLFHSVTEPRKLAGYDIPINALIMVHTFSIANDSKVWPEPEKFNPETYLDCDVDITGAREIRLIPFGVGRRICPGWSIALFHVHLIIARLVQAFEWTTSKPGEEVDMSKKYSFTMVMKNPLQAYIKKRLPNPCL